MYIYVGGNLILEVYDTNLGIPRFSNIKYDKSPIKLDDHFSSAGIQDLSVGSVWSFAHKECEQQTQPSEQALKVPNHRTKG